jgi:hypothetical protein
MASYDRLVDHLPSLWRPQPGDRTLLAEWLAAVGGAFDGAAADAQHVLRAHWADTADAALWDAHYAALRRERGQGAANPKDPQDRREIQRYPYVDDFARLAALLDLPPWRDPASLRETVEEYRQRVADVLDAYRAGLTTVAALRRLVDAALPEDMAAPLPAQRGRFAIEEPVALSRGVLPLTAPPTVQEGDQVGPMARFAFTSDGVPGFVIEGVAATAASGATVAPMVERYTPAAAVKGIGVAYTGTLAAGQALRLLPSRRTWLLREAALWASAEETPANAARDPSANGPWAEAGSVGAGSLGQAGMAADGTLWAIQHDEPAWQVQRFDGTAFAAVDTDAPAGPFHALLCQGAAAWLGTEGGLFRCDLWPAAGPRRWLAVTGVSGAVRVLQAEPAGDGLRAAGAQGVWVLDGSGAVTEQRHATLDLLAYRVDGPSEWLATALALFTHRQAKSWRFDGAAVSENLADWVACTPDNAQTSPLPTVRSVARTADGGLWLATDDGLARWVVDDSGVTRLEAFPELVGGRVNRVQVDDRGLLWVAAEAGLFRFDGRDLAQHELDQALWLPLGAADIAYPDDSRAEPRGHWRYDRAGSRWLRYDGRRFAPSTLPARSNPSEPVADLLLTPALRAELGSFDGSAFQASGAVPVGQLRLRVKPAEDRIVDGAVAYLPTPVPGASWRYLQLCDAPVPPAAGRPWWSTEGQLFPLPQRSAAVPGHHRGDHATFDGDAFFGEGQFDQSVFVYPPSARLWALPPATPALGIRVRLLLADPSKPIDPALAARVWQLIARARPAGIPMQLMAEGQVLKESTP